MFIACTLLILNGPRLSYTSVEPLNPSQLSASGSRFQLVQTGLENEANLDQMSPF
jgi:hypothetical protein